MTQWLRKLLESYGTTPPMRVQTDLSAARAPSFSIAYKSERISGEDVLGRRSYTTAFALYMRHVAASEQDRQRAHEFLQGVGQWLGLQPPMAAGSRTAVGIETSPETLQEAYDDGTAVWTMEIRLLCTDI